MRYKILFISSWFPNKLEPTNGNFVQRHAEAAALFHDVEILHAIGDFHQKEKYFFDDTIINGIRTLIVYYRNTKNPLLNFYRRMKAYQLGYQKMQKPDLVHGNVLHNNLFFAVYLKKKFGIPFVVTEHWTVLRKINEKITPNSVKRTARIIGNRANHLLPVSKDLSQGLQNLGIKTKMKVIPNVVNTHLFLPKKGENQIPVFIHISNLIPRKNADKILQVAIKLWEKGEKFRLQIGGDGDISSLMKIRNNTNFKENIEVFGIQTLPQIADRMQRSDCFILFSSDENQPCVIAEAFASGISVISTNVGGIGEFFPPNFGILLPKVDEDLLEKAMLQFMHERNRATKDEFASYAQENFSQEAIGKQLSEIYKAVLYV